KLEALWRLRRQIDELHELLILVAPDVGEALDLPGHDTRKPIARPDRSNAARDPVIQRDRLPGLVPGERPGRNRRRRGADIRAECEEVVELLEELHVPGLGLGDGELRERWIRIDESLPRDPRVFIAPEPGAAGEIDEEIRAGRVLPHIVDAPAVIAPVVVDERPAIAEAVRLERAVNVRRAVAGIGRARVLHGV